MRPQLSWDDLRYLLAIARHRTLTDAARSLAVSHTTVARRLEQLQHKAKTELLTKTPDGFILTDQGEALYAAAERVENEAHAAERLLVDAGTLQGSLTVTTVDVVVELYWEAFATFMRDQPEIELVIYLDNRPLDLSRRHADLALRYSNAPPSALVGRRIARHGCAPFAAPALVERVGSTKYADYPWILWTADQHARLTERWFLEHVGGAPAARVNHSLALGQMVRAGAGAAILTEAVGRMWGLSPLGPTIEGFDVDIWLLTHPDLKHARRVRAFIDHFVRHLRDDD